MTLTFDLLLAELYRYSVCRSSRLGQPSTIGLAVNYVIHVTRQESLKPQAVQGEGVVVLC